VVILLTATMPTMFMVVAIMVVIPIAFVRLNDASGGECDQSQQEAQFRKTQRSYHRFLRTCNTDTLTQITRGEPSAIGDD
jgi:hypothetical protein